MSMKPMHARFSGQMARGLLCAVMALGAIGQAQAVTCPAGSTKYRLADNAANTNTSQQLTWSNPGTYGPQTYTFGTSGVTATLQFTNVQLDSAGYPGMYTGLRTGRQSLVSEHSGAAPGTLLAVLQVRLNTATVASGWTAWDVDGIDDGNGNNFRDRLTGSAGASVTGGSGVTINGTSASGFVGASVAQSCEVDDPTCDAFFAWGASTAGQNRSVSYFAAHAAGTGTRQAVGFNDFEFCVASTVAPTLSKSFTPASITAGSTSRLTISIGNTNTTAISTTAALVDTLPGYVTVANTPNASTTCTGTVTALAGASTVTLASGATIPSGGCTVSVDVTSNTIHTSGSPYVNTLAAGSLQTSAGNNATAATASLTVTANTGSAAPNQVCSAGTTSYAQTGTTGGTVSSTATATMAATSATYTTTQSATGYGALTLGQVAASAPPSGNLLQWDYASNTATGGDTFSITYSVTPPTIATTPTATPVQTLLRYYGRDVTRAGTSVEASRYVFTWTGGGQAQVYERPTIATTNPYVSGSPAQFSLENGDIEAVNGTALAIGSSVAISSGGTVDTYGLLNSAAQWYIEFPKGVSSVTVTKTTNAGATSATTGRDAIWPQPGTVSGVQNGESFREWGAFSTQLCSPTTTDLIVTKTNNGGTADASGDTLTTGSKTTYTLVATNKGPALSSNTTLTDTPSAGLSACAVKSCTVTGGAGTCPAVGTAVATGGTTFSIASFPVNATMTIQVECTVN